MGRNAGGVYGMDLAKGDYLVGMEPVQPDFEIIKKESKSDTQNLDEIENEAIKDSLTSLMLTVSEKGFGQAHAARRIPHYLARGKGRHQPEIDNEDRNGPVVAALQVTEESDVMIITEYGKVIRVHANEIREDDRSTQGRCACCGSKTATRSPPLHRSWKIPRSRRRRSSLWLE